MKYFVFLGLFFPIFLSALPQGLDVQSGSADIHAKGKSLHIKNSPHAILHWSDFSIGKGEKVHFAQKSAKSVVLNRVTGKNCSHLLGSVKK